MSGYKSRKRKADKKKQVQYQPGTLHRIAGKLYRADVGGPLIRVPPEYAARPEEPYIYPGDAGHTHTETSTTT